MDLSRAVVLVSLLPLLTGCGDADLMTSRHAVPTDVTWRLVSVGPQGGDQTLPDHSSYSVRFLRDLTIRGNDACNPCPGTYTNDSQSRLEISPSCTEMACNPPPAFGYADALCRVTSFYRVGDRLVLVYRHVSGATWELVHVKGD
jgi:heat shock protein HslJ